MLTAAHAHARPPGPRQRPLLFEHTRVWCSLSIAFGVVTPLAAWCWILYLDSEARSTDGAGFNLADASLFLRLNAAFVVLEVGTLLLFLARGARGPGRSLAVFVILLLGSLFAGLWSIACSALLLGCVFAATSGSASMLPAGQLLLLLSPLPSFWVYYRNAMLAGRASRGTKDSALGETTVPSRAP